MEVGGVLVVGRLGRHRRLIGRTGVAAHEAHRAAGDLARARADGGDRRGRQDHHAEDQQQAQHEAGHDRADRRDDRSGGDPADDAAAGRHGLGAVARGRRVHDQVPQADDADEHRGGADDEPAGGGVVVRVAQEPPRESEQDEGRDPRQGADERRHDHVRPRDEPAVHAEPGRGHEGGGSGDQRQPEAVAAVRRIEVASASAHGASRGTEQVGEPEPQAAQQPADRRDEPWHGARSHGAPGGRRPGGLRSGRSGRTSGLGGRPGRPRGGRRAGSHGASVVLRSHQSRL